MKPAAFAAVAERRDEKRGIRSNEFFISPERLIMNKLIISALLATLLAACGNKEAAKPAEVPAAAPAAPAAAAPAAAPAADDKVAVGEGVFKKTCSMCHQTGAAGAPILGNKDDWGPRIAQGKDTLYKHALGGFNGNKGAMPPKGANPALTDDEVKAAVDYMVGKAS